VAESLYEGIPGLSDEEQAIARRRKLAEAMLEQSQQPVQPFTPAGRMVSPMQWSQGLAQLAQAYLGGKGVKKAETGMTGLANKRQQMVSDAMTKYQQESTLAPTTMQQSRMTPDGQRTAQPIKLEGLTDAPEDALFNLLGNPAVPDATRQAAQLKYASGLRREDKAEEREFRREDRLMQAQTRFAEIQMQLADKSVAREQHAALVHEGHDLQRTIAELTRSNVQPVVVTDEAGNTKFFDRQGKLISDAGNVGKPSATFEKTAAAKRQTTLDLDRAIVELTKATGKDGLIDSSTGSGFGAAVDWVANFVGHATEGAKAVGAMAPIYDLALKMVPRFEGPQSEKDTQSYHEASGQLANPNIPNETKKVAALEMLRLMKERRGQFVGKDYIGTEADVPTGEWKDM
jgi:hypothetical protein